MSVSHCVLICFSPTGTTKTVVSAIGKGVGLPVRCVDMTLPCARTAPVAVEPSDLLVIGFPVYAGRLPEIHADIFQLLPRGNNPVVPVVVYGNRAYDDALLELADLCSDKGYTLAGAAGFVGQHSFNAELAAGRPDSADAETARAFGEQIHRTLSAGKAFDPAMIPGNRPYKDVQQALQAIPTPVGAEASCTRCLICVDICPMGVISAADPLQTDTQKCIKCAACIARCPAGSRHMPSPEMKARMEAMAKINADPKQPALFVPA